MKCPSCESIDPDIRFETVIAGENGPLCTGKFHDGLGECDFSDYYVDCREPAVVHDLATENEFCLRHYSEVLKHQN